MKNILANTPVKIEKLLADLEMSTGFIGFDTEVVGPQLRGRDFVNITHSSLLGFSVAFGSDTDNAYYVPVRHKGRNATFLQIHHVFEQLGLAAREERVWAHNAKFDHQALALQGQSWNILMDSMIAGWLVERRNHGLSLDALGVKGPPYDPTIAFKAGADVCEYACADARGTLALAHRYLDDLDWEWFREECYFAKILAEMKLQGIALDKGKLRGLRYQAEKERNRILKAWDDAGCKNISITSSKQLQTLFEEGAWVEHKLTAGGQHSTDGEAMRYQLEHGNGAGPELAQLRLDFQEVSKIVTTYTDGLIEEALQWRDKKLHPDLHHFGTVTGRLSSANPNIQNQPSHGDWAKSVKSCFVPDPGCEFVSADYSQIELRYFANYCGGPLLQAFLDGKDLHEVTAEIMGVTRQLGKTINFGFLLYGGGPRKMAGLLGCSEAEAADKIALLHEGYPEIEAWRKRVIEAASAREPIPYVHTIAGRYRNIPELAPEAFAKHDPEGYKQAARSIAKKYGLHTRKRVDSAMASRGKRLVVNYLVQGGSRDLLVIGMNNFRRTAPPQYRIVTTVHDEVLIQCPKHSGKHAGEHLKQSLESAGEELGLRVPVLAEPQIGDNWAEAK